MKKALMILTVLAMLGLSGCVTYVNPSAYQESSVFTKDYEILGFISVDMPVVQPSDDVTGVKEMAMDAAMEQYPDADDIIDVTITKKMKATFIFFGYIFKYKTTLEGNVIRYLE